MNIKEQKFCDSKVKYPITINFKVICNNTFPDLVNRTHIGMAIEDAGMQYNEIQNIESKKQNFISYTILLNIESEEILNKLYEKIKAIPGFVMAI
jgi:putative lipoic acid-binding regulatory protein